MAVTLSIDGSDYNQTQEYTLDSDSFYINTRYNPRSGWTVSIYDSDNDPTTVDDATPLLAGLRCMAGGLLTWRYKSKRADGLFTGDLYVANNTFTTNTLGKDNFGLDEDYELMYLTEDDLEDYGFSDFTPYS